jgi:tetratricopeptide (TPR) repeat protein
MGDAEAAKADIAESKRLKAVYDSQRINKCKEALALEETPFGYFTLANAYELAGDYQKALFNIDKAISMTELNHAYKRYRAEIIMKSGK